MTPTASKAADAATENFADLLAESFGEGTNIEGSVVRGFVIGIDSEAVIIDVGLKSEGRVPVKEFTIPGQEPTIKAGDTVEVFVERYENKDGEVMLSRDKARREEAWVELEKKFNEGVRVEGVIFNRVKGGFTVDLGGAVAFLPGSHQRWTSDALEAEADAPGSSTAGAPAILDVDAGDAIIFDSSYLFSNVQTSVSISRR